MSKWKSLLGVTLLLAASGLAFGEEPKAEESKAKDTKGEGPRWGYVEGGYIDFSPDAGDSQNGAFVGGSMGLFKMFHIVAEYDDVGDFNFWNAGFGWHGLLGEKADLYATALWSDFDTDNGYAVDIGVRWNLLRWLEVNGQGRWLSLDEGDDDVLFRVGGMATILKGRLGFGANWETGDADTVRAFARFNFGR